MSALSPALALNFLPSVLFLTLHLALCDGGRLGSAVLSCVVPDSSSCIQIILTLDQPYQLTAKALYTPTYPTASCSPAGRRLSHISRLVCLSVCVSCEQREQCD